MSQENQPEKGSDKRSEGTASSSIFYEIEGDLLIIRQNGENDSRAIIECMTTALSDRKLPQGALLLWDGRTAPADASAHKMQRMLEAFEAVAPPLAPTFAVVVATSLQFGVSRMLGAYSDQTNISIQTFYGIDEAKAWLRSHKS